MSENTTKYRPKVGDRVRATLVYEGMVKHVGDVSDMLTLDISGMEGFPDSRAPRYLDVEVWKFEKLADPEPEWVNGDMVERPEGTIVRVDGEWWYVATGHPSGGPGWPCEILYKADRPSREAA